jgi:hypothetical protein
MGAVILYLSTIRQSRSSPSYTFKSQEVISGNSGRTIVKSSIACGIATLLPVDTEQSDSRVYDGFCGMDHLYVVTCKGVFHDRD